jgi:hypothetical protein
MPTAYVKKIADKEKIIKGTNLDMKEVERRWNKAKKIAAEEGHAKEWDYITGIFKKMVGEGYEVFDPTDV